MYRALAGALMIAGVTWCLIGGQPAARAAGPAFTVVEASIGDIRRALDEGRTTSHAVTQAYLARLLRYNGALKAAITINPAALADADGRDRERRAGRARGVLHGIPVAVKDNIQVRGLATTGGALAFRTLQAPYEATLVQQLRDAGAIILAKTTLTELANWVAAGMPTGYNALLGHSVNPYDVERIRRPSSPASIQPGGSSSGIGTAASFWAANVGSETSGSILNPASQTMLVGIKPTVGRISRYGVMPIAAEQDTPGPMARSVTDAAIIFGALESPTPDVHDPATRTCAPPARHDYTRFLNATGLRGARVGIPRVYYYETTTTLGPRFGGGLPAAQRTLMDEAITILRRAGAVVIDPANIPSVIATDPGHNSLEWRICTGSDPPGSRPQNCSIVLRYGMKRDFNAWLGTLGAAAPLRTLAELRAWNTGHAAEGAIAFGQAQLDASDAIDLERDQARYRADRAKDLLVTRDEGIDAALKAHQLDALLFPSYLGASLAARAGYPSIIVPFPAKVPSGEPVAPFGVTFTGAACSEPKLITLAYAFEQATKRRIAPRLD